MQYLNHDNMTSDHSPLPYLSALVTLNRNVASNIKHSYLSTRNSVMSSDHWAEHHK